MKVLGLQMLGESIVFESDESWLTLEGTLGVGLLQMPSLLFSHRFKFAKEFREARWTLIVVLTVYLLGLGMGQAQLDSARIPKKVSLKSPRNSMVMYKLPWLKDVRGVDFRRPVDYDSTTDTRRKDLLSGWAVN
jgi:hypothetical protein